MATGSALKTFHGTLTAAAVDTITLTCGPRYVTVVNKSATDVIYVTTNGVDPVVNGVDTYTVLPGREKMLFNERAERDPNLNNTSTVKLISSGAATYAVERS